MNIICTTLLFITVWDISKGKRSSIIWHILNPPIIIGEDGVLYCNVSAIQNNSTKAATWMKDFDVIVDDKASTNHSKYTQKQNSDGFSLIIKKTDKDDINHQYTCLYEFFSYSAVLGLNKQDFKYIPSKDEVKENINRTSDTIIFADVMFEKIYPLPECFCIANKEKINTNVTVEEEAQTEFLYRIRLKLVCEIHHSECMESVEVLCTVGNDEIVINDEQFVNCLDINHWEKKTKYKINLEIIFICLILGVTVCSLMLFEMKRQCSGRRINSCIEDGVATLSDICYFTLCFRANDGTGEEDELCPLLKNNSDNIVSKWHIISAQKDKDVAPMVYHKIGGHNSIYIQILKTNHKINIAFLRKSVLRLNAFRNVPKMPTKEGQSMTDLLYGPAQKEKDVINMVNYAKLFDKNYAEKLASNELINSARLKKTIPRLKRCPSVDFPVPHCTGVSDVDVLRGSSMIPSWGERKRRKISISSKQIPIEWIRT